MTQKDAPPLPQSAKVSPSTAQAAPVSELTQKIYADLTQLMAQPQSPQTLERILRLMAKWRSSVMRNTIQKLDGLVVQSGPFQGMQYLASASEGSTAARILGVYEASLHPIIEQICLRDYAQIIDVGCAEGYYAVGLARRMPHARIFAHDSNPAARQKCAELAALNGVVDQVQIGGEIGHSDFDICTHAPTLVVCDIEGGEAQLLDPERAHGLLAADILVEVHDCFTPQLSQTIAKRFADSHKLQILHRQLKGDALPAWMDSLSDLDRLMALWEWRAGPTPWLWMQLKDRRAAQTPARMQ